MPKPNPPVKLPNHPKIDTLKGENVTLKGENVTLKGENVTLKEKLKVQDKLCRSTTSETQDRLRDRHRDRLRDRHRESQSFPTERSTQGLAQRPTERSTQGQA